MANKGTQALISSDVSIISKLANPVCISISTSDVAGVQNLRLPVNEVLPSIVDIPLRRADQVYKTAGLKRGGVMYKILTLGMLILMPIQILLSLISVFVAKVGFKPPYRAKVINRIKNSDLVISHSDENFKETASLLPLNLYWILTWWTILVSRTMDIIVARSFGKSVVLFPNSVGPFRTWFGRFIARLSLNSCDYLLIREPISSKIVDNVGVKTTKLLTYDTVLLYNSDCVSPQRFSRPTIGVCAGVYGNSLSKKEVKKYLVAHSKALDSAIETYGFDVVFLPHYITGLSGDDLDISEQILARMKYKSKVKILKANYVAEFKSILDQMILVVSSKMHPAILAATGYVPIVCIAYDHKQTGFFNRLGMVDCLVNIRDVSVNSLSAAINYTMSNKESLRKSIARQIPLWQKHVENTIKIVLMKYI